MNKVFIWADASEQIGYGHFIRSLALADILKQSFECFFFTQKPSEFQRGEVKKICQLIELPDDSSKYNLFLSYLDGTEIVVLDNYFFTSSFEKSIKSKGCTLVCLGTNDRHYYADVVINFTNLSPSDFSSELYTKFCLGLDWTILRSAFYHSYRTIKEGLIICLGGTDQYGYSEIFYNKIRNTMPELKISILATERIGEQRIRSFKDQGVNTLINLSAHEVAYALANSQLAVVSSSGIAIEALSQNVNVIAGYYMENQYNLYNTLNDEGYIWGVDSFNEIECCDRIISSIRDIYSGSLKRKFVASKVIRNYINLFKDLCE